MRYADTLLLSIRQFLNARFVFVSVVSYKKRKLFGWSKTVIAITNAAVTVGCIACVLHATELRSIL